MSLEIDIRKKLSGFTLEIAYKAADEWLGLLGASGSGKSMTLRCIAGISTPDEGRIAINGRTVYDSARGINLPPQQRKAGYLFQNYALFPHLTIRQSLALVLRNKSAAEQKRLIGRTLAQFGLEEAAGQKPPRLSGGQQQRAALARMLISGPEIVMLDEPFSALDSFLRDAVEKELTETVSGFPGTVLLVSHNRDEVYRACSRMVILDRGKISRDGERDAIFQNPLTVAAARLTGCKNIACAHKTGECSIVVPEWNLALNTAGPVPDALRYAGIRARHIRPPEAGETENVFVFSLSRAENRPFSRSRYISAGGSPLLWITDEAPGTPFRPPPDPSPLCLCLPAKHLLLLKE
jgi:molybdate transport system ATP-binding protein